LVGLYGLGLPVECSCMTGNILKGMYSSWIRILYSAGRKFGLRKMIVMVDASGRCG
jgi:hypothetical protein